MAEFITPSLVAALTSLILSLLTLFQFFRNLHFQQKQFDELNNRNFTTKLYDLRLEYYPKAFDITDNIYKVKGGIYDTKRMSTTLDELINWKKGIINLIISVEVKDSFFVLRDILMKNPGDGSTYSKEQNIKIKAANKNFRKQLRRDIGFLYREEKKRRKSK